MTYSYTQISQYLRCPRSYRHRYLDGWQERDTRAAMLFGRCFEKALASFFLREDSAVVLSKEWGAYRDTQLEYRNGETWDRVLHQGVQLLEQFARDNRIRVRQPQRNLQLKLIRQLPNGNDFVAYIDGLGSLDGTRCLLEWKTTTSRYAEEPEGMLALDPQLICYSWISGIPDVAMIVFIRKRVPEIQYLRAAITEEQRREFGNLVGETVGRIGAGQFPPHSGIRFPQNGCISCPFLGHCLGNQQLVEAKLIRKTGASDLDWLDLLDE